MRLRATDAFRASLTTIEQAALGGRHPDITIVGAKLGTTYRAELYRGGRSVGVGTSQRAAILAIAAALEDKPGG